MLDVEKYPCSSILYQLSRALTQNRLTPFGSKEGSHQLFAIERELEDVSPDECQKNGLNLVSCAEYFFNMATKTKFGNYTKKHTRTSQLIL